MAANYLAIPATSVPSERLFSAAGDLITVRRNCLSAENARAQLCLGEWWGSETGIVDFKL